ncbi:hypothetical protein GCM10011610_56120 [Nocardia rhizosphaerihabitans]|uniref:Uncharacterized protein n=1 Tax=Nocardia rhizosphaerihabitans TaxID=1691570 RepID=A0ABQ2KUK5_9NOCA|nr:hypothetical protein GCM10011610_56120 [Nocardia rhizosphaerihabitans]
MVFIRLILSECDDLHRIEKSLTWKAFVIVGLHFRPVSVASSEPADVVAVIEPQSDRRYAGDSLAKSVPFHADVCREY